MAGQRTPASADRAPRRHRRRQRAPPAVRLPAAAFAAGRGGGRLVRQGVLLAPLAPLALVTAAPTAASATTTFAALAWSVERRHARRLRRGSGHARAQPDLVLAVVELVEGNEALVRRLHHELREA